MNAETLQSLHRRHRFATPMDVAVTTVSTSLFVMALVELITPFLR